MDLEVEFKRLKEGQEKILQIIAGRSSRKNDGLKVYTLDEVAKFFSVTKRTIYNWKEEGRLPVVVIGSKSYLTETQLQEFLTNHEVKSFKIRRAI